MNRRKLLLLTYYFPPCAAVATHRGLAFTRYLPAMGWDVVVVAPPKMAWEPDDPGLLERVPAGTHVERVPFPRNLWTRTAGRYFPNEMWLSVAWKAVQRLVAEHRPDAVYSTSPPPAIHTLGYRVKMKYALPWVVCLRDPWVTNQPHYMHSRLHKVLDTRNERRAFRHADAIVANTPSNCAGLHRAFPEHAAKTTVLTNGFDPSDFPAPVPTAPGKTTVTMLHAGEFYFGRDPRPLMDAMRDLREQPIAGLPRLKLLLLGRQSEGKFDIATEIAKRGLQDDVQFLGQVPYREALDQMMRADLLLVMHTPGLQGTIPAKVFEYLGTGKPIFVQADPGGDIDWALQKAGVTHRVAAQNDPAGIKKAIAELATEIHDGRAHGADPDKVQLFTREQMARGLVEHLNRLVPEIASRQLQRS